jgi:hypothetical protein
VGDVMRWLYALVIAGVLSAFTLLLLTGRYIEEGPVVASVTTTHGLHAGDLFVLAGWAAGMATLALLARTPARTRT